VVDWDKILYKPGPGKLGKNYDIKERRVNIHDIENHEKEVKIQSALSLGGDLKKSQGADQESKPARAARATSQLSQKNIQRK
jgi:hypothetical protein